jgi:hypothetical protein
MFANDPKRTSAASRAPASSRVPEPTLWPYDICCWVMGRVDRPACGVSRCRELIAVAVAQIDRDPVVCDCLVDPALEIAVANVEKIIALKRAAHHYPMAHKNAEYLAANFFVGEAVRHGASVREMRLYVLYQIAPAVRWPRPILESYPPYSGLLPAEAIRCVFAKIKKPKSRSILNSGDRRPVPADIPPVLPAE